MSIDPGFGAVRHATCAIGYVSLSPEKSSAGDLRRDFEVLGTGFAVGPRRRILTCAHVLDELQAVIKRRQRSGRPAHALLQFVVPALDGTGWTAQFCPMRPVNVNDDADLALLEARDPPARLLSVPLVDRHYVPAVGEDAAVCGYAHGSALLTRGKETIRFGPVLQRGIVAARSPYDIPHPDVVLLDVIAGPAASGSPVLRVATGEAFGVLFEGQIKQSAAFSAARLIYAEPTGDLGMRWARTRSVEL